MRMSDWSSDVCSSDLLSNVSQCAGTAFRVAGRQPAGGRSGAGVEGRQPDGPPLHRGLRRRPALSHLPEVRLRPGQLWPPCGRWAPLDRLPCHQCSALRAASRSEEHTSELQSLMRISYAVFCLKKKKKEGQYTRTHKIEER